MTESPSERTPENELGKRDLDVLSEAFANPGVQMLMAAVKDDPEARETLMLTYEWLQTHDGCPPVDPGHMRAVWRFAHRDKGKTARRWRKELSKADPSKKQLFKSLPRRFRPIATVMLKAVEEVETGAHASADAEQVEMARRICTIEIGQGVLGIADSETFTEANVASVLEIAESSWDVKDEDGFTFERVSLNEPEGIAQMTITDELLDYCFDDEGAPLANLEVETGDLEGLDRRGMIIRLRPLDFAGPARYHRLTEAALSLEKHLVRQDLLT
jgi:hypothetical protein